MRLLLAMIEGLRLVWSLRGRLRGRYWRWRIDTAEGKRSVSAKDRRRAAIDYLHWRRSMRRLMR